MIRSKDLHVLLREVVEHHSGGAMLISNKGAILASAGFEQQEPKVVSAISAHIWAHVALVPTQYPAVGDLRTLARPPASGSFVELRPRHSRTVAALFRRGRHARARGNLRRVALRLRAASLDAVVVPHSRVRTL